MHVLLARRAVARAAMRVATCLVRGLQLPCERVRGDYRSQSRIAAETSPG